MPGIIESFLERRPLLRSVLGVRRNVKRLEPSRPLPREVISLRRMR
jgi:hypothetical protein